MQFSLDLSCSESEQPLAADTERQLLGGVRWSNAKTLKQSPPKIRLGITWDDNTDSDSEAEITVAGA